MAKYGTFRYGSGTKYGTGDAVESEAFTGNHIWVIDIDWEGEGTFTGTNEAIYLLDLPSFFRGHRFYTQLGGGGFEAFETGRFTITMDNQSRRYDPYNTSSPLYPNVVPGRRIQISTQEISGGNASTKHVLFTGEIEDIRPSNDGKGKVSFDVVDGMQKLNDQPVTTNEPSYYIGVSDAISKTLLIGNWDQAKDIKSDSQPLVRFDLDDDRAGAVLQELADASLGQFFVSRYGVATFYNRGYNSMTTHNIDKAVLHDEIPTSQPWDNVRNDIKVVANKPMKGQLKTVWDIPAPIKVNASETRTVTASWDGDYMEVVLTATQARDGVFEATDISRNITVSYDIRAHSATFYLTNTNAVVPAYVNRLTLQGRELEPQAVEFTATDSTSVGRYGQRGFELNNRFLQNINHAEAFATIIKDELKDPNKAPIIKISGRPDIQFGYELLDKVALTVSTLDIDDTYYIGGIEYTINGGKPQDVTTTLYLQPRIYNNDSIDDDPFDPGEPTVPESPIYTPTPIPITPPPPTTLDCINDPAAAQNGPYPIYAGGSQYIENFPTRRESFDINVKTVVRMSTANHKTRVSIVADRQALVDGFWTPTTNQAFFEIWAIDSTGAPLFKAEEITTSGDNISAVFSPDAGTIIAGIRIKMIEPPDNTMNETGYTFTFTGGTQGWYPAPQNASYPNGNIGGGVDPYSFRAAWDTDYWRWTGGKLETRPYDSGYTPPDKINCWVYRPDNVWTKEGATMTGTFEETLSFSGFGCYTYDGNWYYVNADNGTQTRTIIADEAGEQVKYFVFQSQSAREDWQTMDNAIFTGFTVGSNSFRMLLKSAAISNICDIPES
jgi:hypothetical protein